jgi:hypothetical protein
MFWQNGPPPRFVRMLDIWISAMEASGWHKVLLVTAAEMDNMVASCTGIEQTAARPTVRKVLMNMPDQREYEVSH